MKLEREIRFTPAYNKIDEGYGRHGVNMRWCLKGPEGVVQFLVHTSWMLPEDEKELSDAFYHDGMHMLRPRAADLGYHSPKPMYKEQTSLECDLMPTGQCYYDGSTLNAEPVFDLLIREGHEAVWEQLENYYQQTFLEDD